MNDVVSFTHRRDPDGIGSGAIVRRYAEKSKGGFRVFFADYHTMGNDIKQLEGVSESHIVVSDIRLDSQYLAEAGPILTGARDSGCRIDWFDHHVWDGDTRAALEGLVDSLVINPSLEKRGRRCAAQLVCEGLMEKDGVSRLVSYIASTHDFADVKTSAIAGLWADAIQYCIYQGRDDKLERMVSEISRGSFRDPAMLDDRDEYLAARDAAFGPMLGNAELVRAGKTWFSVSCADPILSSTDACTALMDEAMRKVGGPVVGLVVFYSGAMQRMNGKISIRRPEHYLDSAGVPLAERVSCSKVARLFGGGGREDAAGGLVEAAGPEEMKAGIIRKLVGNAGIF